MDREFAARVFSCIDNTTLGTTDTEQSVEAFCRRTLDMRVPCAGGEATVAAVCVYPRFVTTAAWVLAGSGIKVASVASDFPHGQTDIMMKDEDMKSLVRRGADEVDIVINRGLIVAGRADEAVKEIVHQKMALGSRKLKVILETCDLKSPEMIRAAAQAAIDGGADFIKTSTGKGGVGATPEAAEVMLNCIKENVKKSKKTVGFKAAGGIRKPEDALMYAELAQKIMGDEYINRQTFRIGASSLTEAMYALLTN